MTAHRFSSSFSSGSRRCFLQALLSASAYACFWRADARAEDAAPAKDIGGPSSWSDAKWRERLTAKQYDILRREGTEAPFSSDLLKEHRAGVFCCIGCNAPLFSSQAKFDSGTGWPSFFEALPGRLGEKRDYRLAQERVEYHCVECGGHHGHVFRDGPAPTGLRYCNNGVALRFLPRET